MEIVAHTISDGWVIAGAIGTWAIALVAVFELEVKRRSEAKRLESKPLKDLHRVVYSILIKSMRSLSIFHVSDLPPDMIQKIYSGDKNKFIEETKNSFRQQTNEYIKEVLETMQELEDAIKEYSYDEDLGHRKNSVDSVYVHKLIEIAYEFRDMLVLHMIDSRKNTENNFSKSNFAIEFKYNYSKIKELYERFVKTKYDLSKVNKIGSYIRLCIYKLGKYFMKISRINL
jgi:hypothetical protein